jgi:hypothetical protein
VVVLAGLVVALACARGLVALVDAPDARPGALVELDPAEVARVVLSRGARRLVLERSGAGWLVRDGARSAPALPRVDALLARVRAWRRDRPAGADPSRHAAHGVDDEGARGLRLEAQDGRVLADLLVGRIAGIELADSAARGGAVDTTRLGLFARVRGDDATWVVNEFFTRELEPDPDAWLAPPFFGLARDVTRVVVGALILTLGEDGGRVEGDARAPDPLKVHALVGAVLGLAPTTLGGDGDRPPADALRVQVTTRDGSVREARVWRVPPSTRALALSSGSVIELDPRTVERLLARLREGVF